MKTAVNLAASLIFCAGFYWIMSGGGGIPLPIRIAIVVGSGILLGVTVAIFTAMERRRRRERNQAHYAGRGFSFQADVSTSDVFNQASLFEKQNVRIEQLARGKYGEAEVDVYDLSYDVTSDNSDGVSTTRTHYQTVVSLPDRQFAGSHFHLFPLRGWSGGLIRLLGLTGTVTRVESATGDSTLVDWFNGRYAIATRGDLSRSAVEQSLDDSVLQWLQRHDSLAFEVSDRQLLVWTPGRLVDSNGRDELVNEALELAAKLEGRKSTSPGVVMNSVVTTPQGLMFRLVLSGFASWAIATVVMMSAFFAVIGMGWVQRAPLVTIIGLMLLTCLVWFVSGAAIYRFLTRQQGRRTDSSSDIVPNSRKI